MTPRYFFFLLLLVSVGMVKAEVISYYDFEEGSDGFGKAGSAPTLSGWVLDSGTVENNLTVINSVNGSPYYSTNVSVYSTGNLSLGFGLNGSDNRSNAVQPVLNDESFQWYGEQSKTMEFFVSRAGDGWDGSATEYVFSKSFLSWGGWDITFNRETKTIKFSIRDQAMSSTTSFENNEWHHVAVVRDVDTNTYTLYVDYIAEASIEYSSGSVKNEPLAIGAGYGWTSARSFYGAIDDLRISDESLDPNAFLRDTVYKANEPVPHDGVLSVKSDATLTWSAGDYAVSHKVYLGLSYDAVDAADENSPEYKGEFDSMEYTSTLAVGKTYYWRVDEVNSEYAGSPWKGDVWSFTVKDYIAIDDFEQYNEENPLDSIWSFSIPDPNNLQSANFDNGATMHFSGNNSMMFVYDLGSETEVDYAQCTPEITDWTQSEVKALTFVVRGDEADIQFGVEISDSVNSSAVTFEGEDKVFGVGWKIVSVALDDFTGVDLANVQSLKFFVANGIGAGKVYVDLIVINQSRCTENPESDFNGDCVVDIEDFIQLISEDWASSGMWP